MAAGHEVAVGAHARGVETQLVVDVGDVHLGRRALADGSDRAIHAVEAERLFVELAWNMADEINQWDRGSGFARIRPAWLDRAYGIGERITVNLNDRVIEGSFDTLDDEGRLVLERPGGGRETISAGDLFFAGRA